MSEQWRNRILYWLLVLVPMGGLYTVRDSVWFLLFLFFFISIYMPLVDTQRLMSLNKIEEKDAWRFFVPFAVDRTAYLKSLWLG